MPKDSLQITILLASPGDVPKERKAVREAAEEINIVTGEDEGFHLVVKGWETHTRPAAGRAQGNINTQIGPTDIFLDRFDLESGPGSPDDFELWC